MGKIQYSILPGLFAAANQQFIEKCSELYSNHYGIWGGEGVHPNKNIKLSVLEKGRYFFAWKFHV